MAFVRITNRHSHTNPNLYDLYELRAGEGVRQCIRSTNRGLLTTVILAVPIPIMFIMHRSLHTDVNTMDVSTYECEIRTQSRQRLFE